MHITPVWIVGFSGHRPSTNGNGRSLTDIQACRDSLATTLKTFQKKCEDAGGRCELACGIAEGADLLAISIAEEIGMPVHVFSPLEPDLFKQDFLDANGQPNPAWSEVTSIIEKAQKGNSDWTFRVTRGTTSRPGCYHNANLQLLEISDVFVSIFNGESTNLLGGTSEVIRHAGPDHLRIPTVIIDPASEGRVTREEPWSPYEDSPDNLRAINEQIVEKTKGKPLRDSRRAFNLPVEDFLCGLDSAADHQSSFFRNSLRRSVWLHFWATICATISASFAKVFAYELKQVPWILTAIELILVVLAFTLIWRISRLHVGNHWRRFRMAAEISDSMISTACLVDPLFPVIGRHDTSWRRFAVSLGLTAFRQKQTQQTSQEPSEKLSLLVEPYSENRLGGQLAYFRSQSITASRKLRRWKFVAEWASLLAIPAIFAALMMKLTMAAAGKDWITAFFVLGLPIVLPLLAGLSSSLIVVDDSARRATRHSQVVERLQRLSKLLSTAKTASSAERIVLEIEDILLDEIIEWNATAKNMGH